MLTRARGCGRTATVVETVNGDGDKHEETVELQVKDKQKTSTKRKATRQDKAAKTKRPLPKRGRGARTKAALKENPETVKEPEPIKEKRIQFMMISTIERKPYTSAQYPQKVITNLNDLREDSRFCDVEIVAGGVIHAAHRAVLSASSAYFEAMFRPDREFCEGKQKSVILHTIDPEILKILLEFIYTGQIHITQINVQELLEAASMLQLIEVFHGCSDFLCRELHATNALGILWLADAHNSEKLAESALKFINSHFLLIALEDEFLDTPQTLLLRLLKSEFLSVKSESQVFEAALRWIKHDVAQRRCDVFEILSHVRLALMPTHHIAQAIKDCPDVLLSDALRSIHRDISTKRGQLVPLSVCPRTLIKENNEFIFNLFTKSVLSQIKENETAPMKIGRLFPGIATLNGKIYVVGGERGIQILANGEVYNPQNNSWQPIAPMTVPRCEFGLCTVGGTLWAVGGWLGNDIGSSMESYDPIKDTWTSAGDMPKPKFGMGVVSYNELIYIVGGLSTSRRCASDLICYNPVTQKWSQLARMQTTRCQMGVSVLDKNLYVVGGISGHSDILRTVERYDFEEDKWTMVKSMSVRRAIPSVASVNGMLYVAGGDQTCELNSNREQVIISSVECYDPMTNTWRNCPDLPMSRSQADAIVFQYCQLNLIDLIPQLA